MSVTSHQFQIDLRGIIDLLANHLYSSPSVYLRELLQNGVDAIRARKALDPEHSGRLRVEVAISDKGRPQIVFMDDGVGLTESETHEFLATIGRSSKRGEEGAFAAMREDYIGQFGIGLLSCFVVSDEILMVSRSARPDQPSVEWRGKPDGTYSVSLTETPDTALGTAVYLSCRPGCEEWFRPQKVRELLLHFGALLPYPIEFQAPEQAQTVINAEAPPWRAGIESPTALRDACLGFGNRLTGQHFLDAIPLNLPEGGIEGAAYILAHAPSPTAKPSHRVYLKHMFLSDRVDNLLPPWAFFVTCVLDARDLRPTASRESFYEDAVLEGAREALGKAIRDHLVMLHEREPERLKMLIGLHFRAIKALAVHDPDFLALVMDWLPFETNLGWMTFGEYRQKAEVVRHVPSVDVFRQLARVAAAQRIPLLNSGYSYNLELIQIAAQVLPGLVVQQVGVDDIATHFDELAFGERQAVFELLGVAKEALQPFGCEVEVRKFSPEDLPALYMVSDEGRALRTVRQTREIVDDHWAGVLDALGQGGRRAPQAVGRLCLNYHSDLIRRLAMADDKDAQRLGVRVLYAQSLLLGHHPLSSAEMGILNEGLLELISRGLVPPQGMVH